MIIKKEIHKINQQLKVPFSTPDFLDKAYLPSLDGWRAVAIIIVILGHAKLTVSPTSLYYKFAETFIYAELGVKIFFVLSGFLITTLLIKEFIKNGKINISHFFLKRVLRIFPVLHLYLVVILILNQIFNLGLNSDHFLGPILYINNFNIFSGTWLTGHTWSLAVEEQFYLIWPLLFSLLTKNLWIFCLTIILAVPLLKVLWYFRPSYYEPTAGPFLANADAIFSGALLAILAFKSFFKKNKKIWTRKGIDLVFISIIFISVFCVNRGYFGLLFYPCSSTICNIMICLLFLRTIIGTKTLLYKFLNKRAMIHLGLISYSLYIWQQLFLVPTDNYAGRFNTIRFPLNIIVALIIAYLSYHYFEKYFLKFKGKYIK